AAIIAAGGSPLGLGTDIGGSVRFPAAFCGIASMKPTAGRLPDLGRYSMPVGQTAIASQVGVMARHVDDVALGLSIVNEGVQPIDDAPRPLGDYRSVDLAGLRVAVFTDDGLFPVSPANERAVREAAGMLADAGATVSEWTPPGMDEAYALLTGIFSADGGAAFRALLGRDKRDPRISMLVTLAGRSRRMLGVLESALSAAGQASLAKGLRAFGHADTSHYWKMTERLLDYRLRFRAAMEAGPDGPIDLILGPAGALPAWTHGASRDLVLGGAYVPLYNVLGYPAGIVPVTTVRAGEESRRQPGSDMVQRLAAKVEEGSAGLPIGVQIAARPWREHVALAAMREIERQAALREGYPRTPVVPHMPQA
ncbi:amidase, partial [Oxalobacteraceae bacterium OM1]